MTYTAKDAEFDDLQLNGPTCRRHGTNDICNCCRECGRPNGKHETWCSEVGGSLLMYPDFPANGRSD